MKSRSHAPSPGVWTLVIVLGLLVLWEVAAAGGHVNEFFFSRPSLLWQEFVDMVSSGLLARHLSTTGQEAGLGLLFGGVLGTLAGLGLGISPRVSRALMPLMTGLNGLPKLALGPLFIIWFGLGLQSKVLISALMVFFIFAFNLYSGVRSVDPALVAALRGHRRGVLGLHPGDGLAAVCGRGCVQRPTGPLLRAGAGGHHRLAGRGGPPAGAPPAAVAALLLIPFDSYPPLAVMIEARKKQTDRKGV